MRLELKDVESSMVYTVDSSGAVLGRERARTDISFRDESISKRHARIYAERGSWFIEDLGSSNGTYVHDERIVEPVSLSRGLTFSLAQRRFEVVEIQASELAGRVQVTTDPTQGDASGLLLAAASQVEPATPSLARVLWTVPAAVAFYAAAVPRMAVRPVRSVQKSAEEEPMPAMSRGELSAYGLVALGIASLLGTVVATSAGLLTGGSSPRAVMAALPYTLIAGLLGAVSGVLLHPALSWLVRVLRGTSTAKSRTNFALSAYTFALLAAFPSGLAPWIGLSRLPYPGVVTIALGLLVSLMGTYIFYRWALAFGVISGIRYLVLVLGGLAVVFACAQAVPILMGGSKGAAAGQAAIDPDLVKMREKAMARAAALEPDSSEPSPELQPSTGQLSRAAHRSDPHSFKPAEDTTELPTETDSTPEEDPGYRAGRTATGRVLATEHPLGTTDFLRFRKKREAVERAIHDDPSLVNRKDIVRDYAPMWRTTYEIRDKWDKLMLSKPQWERDKILARKREYEIFRRTHKYVDRLYTKLF